MKYSPVKNLLRGAVIAAIPLTGQVGCANTETVKNTDPDPCRTGESTRQSVQENFSTQIALLTKPLSSEECIALCEQTFRDTRIGGFNDLVKLERMAVDNCVTENRPYSDMIPGGRRPQPSTRLSCSIDYTAIHSPYTCPRPVPGRMPHGLQRTLNEAVAGNVIGRYLADMAAMETAAITAFRYLSRELEAYGAPPDLIARARQAVTEETRHAEMAGLLSAAYETGVQAVQVDDFVLRPLYDIALDNAVEGCVNETFAAACGLWQGEHAQLDTFRRVIAHISDEETEHAALSWDIHAWVMPLLSAAEQAQIRAAQAAAVEHLVADFRQEGDPLLQQAFGLPTRQQAARLFAQLKTSVWATVAPLQAGGVSQPLAV